METFRQQASYMALWITFIYKTVYINTYIVISFPLMNYNRIFLYIINYSKHIIVVY